MEKRKNNDDVKIKNKEIEIMSEDMMLSSFSNFPALSFLNQRKVYLFGEIDTEKISEVIQHIHTLETFDPKEDISLYINSYGGYTSDCLALVDVMDSCSCDIQTIVFGSAYSAACVIAANGTPGKRYAGKSSRFMYHESYYTLHDVSAKHIAYHEEMIKTEEELFTSLMHRNTGQTKKIINEVFLQKELDHFVSSAEAKKFGIIDHIVKNKRRKKIKVTPYKAEANKKSKVRKKS